MNRGLKYRIYPNTEQQVLFAKTFVCCRKVWNLMLSDKVNSYNETGSFGKQTPAMYKEDFPFLKEVDSLALCNVQLNIQQAFTNCFSKERKSKTKFPKFKSKNKSKKSYTTNNNKNSIRIEGNFVKLPKVGLVKIKLHRITKDNWIIKSATISQEPDGKFYISILYEFEQDVALVGFDESNIIGLDYKSDGLYIDSNGNIGSNHKYYKESQDKLAKEQQIGRASCRERV